MAPQDGLDSYITMTKTGENNNNNDDNGSKDDYAGDNNNNDASAVECHSGTCVGDGCCKSTQNIFSRYDHG